MGTSRKKASVLNPHRFGCDGPASGNSQAAVPKIEPTQPNRTAVIVSLLMATQHWCNLTPDATEEAPMDATMNDGQGSSLPPLPTRTKAPVRHAERLEFLSNDWVDAVRAYLAPRVAERADALRGKRAAFCEIFTDAPPHLG